MKMKIWVLAIILAISCTLCGCSARDIQPLHSRVIQPIPSVILNFNSESQSRLRNVPIWTNPFVTSTIAQTVAVVPLSKVKILVSTWFPRYALTFQTELLVHEYLHVLQAEDKNIDIQAFHRAVQVWFNDMASGLPTTTGNYTKYYLTFNLYGNPKRYKEDAYPEEEYAYIGTMLSRGGKRLDEIPANIKAYYKGILN